MDAAERGLGWRSAMAELFMPEVSERGADPMREVFRLD